MVEKYYEALQKRENLRENLVGLRAQIKDEAGKRSGIHECGRAGEADQEAGKADEESGSRAEFRGGSRAA